MILTLIKYFSKKLKELKYNTSFSFSLKTIDKKVECIHFSVQQKLTQHCKSTILKLDSF